MILESIKEIKFQVKDSMLRIKAGIEFSHTKAGVTI